LRPGRARKVRQTGFPQGLEAHPVAEGLEMRANRFYKAQFEAWQSKRGETDHVFHRVWKPLLLLKGWK
jgi:hypothetical protein